MPVFENVYISTWSARAWNINPQPFHLNMCRSDKTLMLWKVGGPGSCSTAATNTFDRAPHLSGMHDPFWSPPTGKIIRNLFFTETWNRNSLHVLIFNANMRYKLGSYIVLIQKRTDCCVSVSMRSPLLVFWLIVFFCRAFVDRVAVSQDHDSSTRRTCILAYPQTALSVLWT